MSGTVRLRHCECPAYQVGTPTAAAERPVARPETEPVPREEPGSERLDAPGEAG